MPPPIEDLPRTWEFLTVPARRFLRGEVVRGEARIIQSLERLGHNVGGATTRFGVRLAQYGLDQGDLGPESWETAHFEPVEPAMRRLRSGQAPALDVLRAALGRPPEASTGLIRYLAHHSRGWRLSKLGGAVMGQMVREVSALSAAQRRFLLDDVVTSEETPFLVQGQRTRVARSLQDAGIIRMDGPFPYYTDYGAALALVWRGRRRAEEWFAARDVPC